MALRLEPPSPASLLLRAPDAPRRDPRALADALALALARPGAHWATNLLDEAARRRLPPAVLELLLAHFRRSSRLRPPGSAAFDREALVGAARAQPQSPQAALLLASVAPRGARDEPLFPLRLLLAAAQSRCEPWALAVLSARSDVRAAVRATAVPLESEGESESESESAPTARAFVVEAAQEAIRSDQCALLRALLALNRPAVEAAAVAWTRRMDEIGRSAAAGRRLSDAASRRLDHAAAEAARALVAAVERRETWQRVRPIAMARRRLARPQERAGKQARWMGLGGVTRRLRRRTEPAAAEAAPHAIVLLPDALFASVLSFLVARDLPAERELRGDERSATAGRA